MRNNKHRPISDLCNFLHNLQRRKFFYSRGTRQGLSPHMDRRIG
ncbi:hypothetical protein HMPREF0201_01202 [Cedecea davisae DSM 4568]|uniref:Uncharacterized protein n=1 Tax=Cedecea davisae DSM 4568 TaxID=566551 RepID=S3IY30_9ENTR|nr:hypothetical protein HMPREF0201_01202 [Cedecea davisae DSM 4568]